jgi:hypothetical protein
VSDHETMMGQLSALLASAPRDRGLIEQTLTDGYAHALSLEAERWRVQKRLRALAAAIEPGDLEEKTKELSDLARRIELQDGVLAQLRELLARLRAEYTEVAAATSPRRRSSAAK